MLSNERGVALRASDRLLADMYRDRKRVFIDLLGWDLPVLDGSFEIDQFDGPETLYLILGSPDGAHLGSLRLLPTDQPTILNSFFEHLCDADAPRSPKIWELSRLCLSPNIRAAQRREVRNRLLSSAVVFALQNGITRFCCVTHGWYIPEVLSYGWRCLPLGAPQIDPSGMVGALEIFIDEATPERMSQAGTWDENPVQISRESHPQRGDVQ